MSGGQIAMKRVVRFSPAVLLMSVLLAVSPRAEQNMDKTTCSLVQQALRDSRQVKNATTRGDVVKYFVPDGGLQFPAKTRYVHPRCEYLHVDVEFELVKPSEIASLPDDKVIGVSKRYVEYTAKD
jgi:hypothetical protein